MRVAGTAASGFELGALPREEARAYDEAGWMRL